MKFLTVIFLMLFLVSCEDDKKPEPTPTPKPIETKPIEVEEPVQAIALKQGWFPEYNKIVMDAVKNAPHLLKYNKDPKWWADFFCGVAGAESGYKPWDTFPELSLGVSCMSVVKDKKKCQDIVDDYHKNHKYGQLAMNNPSKYGKYKAYIDRKGWDRVTKTFYLSEGLLQLSYSDKGYYGCDFDFEGDVEKFTTDQTKSIFDPKKNLECGVIILNRLVGKKGTPYYNSGHYWAVLKPSNSRHKDFFYYKDKCSKK